MRSPRRLQPFATRSRRTILVIVVMMALVSTISATLSIRAASNSRHRATVVQVAGRQRALVERYVQEVLLVREAERTDPAHTASLLALSARALLDGGLAPAANGDDDEAHLPRSSDPTIRAQLLQEQRLIADLSRVGAAVLNGADASAIPLTAHEHIAAHDPVQRLRVLAALTSSVSLNVSRTIVARDDANISNLITILIALGAGGLVASLVLAWALITATRRQTEHYRSLVSSSTDLVLVMADGCRYVSASVEHTLGRPESELLGDGLERFVHQDDRALVEAAQRDGPPSQLVFRMRNADGDWRHLEANVSDLRHDRQIRGVVLNARDITDRVRLQQELTEQAQRDTFGAQLVEALEMADEEEATFEVVRRAMVEISAVSPMELLLSDSSRAHLERAAVSPAADPPACPVQSPFSCVAVRRGNPVVFETSESLNACPKLRGRPDGPCSAVCVPVSFMGRALGVLHATGPVGAPPAGSQVAQLTTLATQAGARIGTVRAFQRTQMQASTDGLTGLANRRTLEEQLRDLTKQGHPFALAIADLDRFKQLNDTHGHEAGDNALRTFSKVAQATLRDDDSIARWGGEEFVIVLPDIGRHQAINLLERLRSNLGAAHSANHPPFTSSFGVTDSTRASTLEELLQLADAALYKAKAAGRDRIHISDAAPDAQSFAAVNTTPNAATTRSPRRDAVASMHHSEDDPPASGPEIR